MLIKVKNLTKMYTSGYVAAPVFAVKNMSFDVRRKEIVSLIGESGSGKTTIAKMILRLLKPTSGQIFFKGKNIFSLDKRDYWKKVQGTFQDPYSSFNPFYNVDRYLDLPFKYLAKSLASEKKKAIKSVLELVGLKESEVLGKYPHQLSGGQRQRIMLAMSLIVDPEMLVTDEPTSMVDASLRIGLLDLILKIKKIGKSILFITHDIGQARYLSDRVVVIYKGEAVEEGSTKKVFTHPKHEYTRRLLTDTPRIDRKWEL